MPYGLHPTAQRSFPENPHMGTIRQGQPYSHASVNSGSNNRPSVPNPAYRKEKPGMRRLSYRERKRRGLALSDSWTTDDRGEEGIPKSAARKKNKRMDRVVSKVRRKGGFNPTGKQFRDYRTTPGSAGTNALNNLVRRTTKK